MLPFSLVLPTPLHLSLKPKNINIGCGMVSVQPQEETKTGLGRKKCIVLTGPRRAGWGDGHHMPCKATGEAPGLGQEAEHRGERGA